MFNLHYVSYTTREKYKTERKIDSILFLWNTFDLYFYGIHLI